MLHTNLLFFVIRVFVNNNLPRIPKGLNVNNRPVQQDGLTAKRLPNSEGVECGNHF